MSGMFIELAAVLGFISGIALVLGSFEPRYVRLPLDVCSQCSYSRRGLSRVARCPECGSPAPSDAIISVRRRTRWSLRAALNICLYAMAMIPIQLIPAAMWYVLCRASGFEHARAWALSAHPERFIAFGTDVLSLHFVIASLALWVVIWGQVRFGSLAFRKMACGVLLTGCFASLAITLWAWFGDELTWASVSNIHAVRSHRPFVIGGLALGIVVLAAFWRSFRRSEEAVIVRLRAEPDGPEHLRAP